MAWDTQQVALASHSPPRPQQVAHPIIGTRAHLTKRANMQVGFLSRMCFVASHTIQNDPFLSQSMKADKTTNNRKNAHA